MRGPRVPPAKELPNGSGRGRALHAHLLDACGGDRRLATIRVLGLTLLTFGLLVTFLVLASLFLVEGGGQLLMAGAVPRR